MVGVEERVQKYDLRSQPQFFHLTFLIHLITLHDLVLGFACHHIFSNHHSADKKPIFIHVSHHVKHPDYLDNVTGWQLTLIQQSNCPSELQHLKIIWKSNYLFQGCLIEKDIYGRHVKNTPNCKRFIDSNSFPSSVLWHLSLVKSLLALTGQCDNLGCVYNSLCCFFLFYILSVLIRAR